MSLCTLHTVKGVFDLLDGAVKLLECEPRIPHRLWPVEVLAVHVVEDVAGGVDLALFAVGEWWSIKGMPIAREKASHQAIRIRQPNRVADLVRLGSGLPDFDRSGG